MAGVRVLPVATSVAIAYVVGTKLEVRFGAKLEVTLGLVLLAVFFTWVSIATITTTYLTIAITMVICGTGMGLTSAPATEAIMGVVPAAKAGVGSAVNDATRLLGATLGVAFVGSVYASVYGARLTATLPAGLPGGLAHAAHQSIGAALGVAGRLGAAHHAALADTVHTAAAHAFTHGLSIACLVAAGVSAAGAVIAGMLLPAHPSQTSVEASSAPTIGQAATALD